MSATYTLPLCILAAVGNILKSFLFKLILILTLYNSMPLFVNLFRLLLKLVSNVSDMLVDIDFGRVVLPLLLSYQQ